MQIERVFEFKVRVRIKADSEDTFWRRLETVKSLLRCYLQDSAHLREVREEQRKHCSGGDVATNANISESITL